MTPHDTALARLTGAREQHTLAKPVVKLIAGILRDHDGDCVGTRHILGRPECRAYRAALVVLGIGGTR